MSAEREMVAGSSEPATGDSTVSIQIQRVPSFMRLNKQNSHDYDPKVVSLGPYHHGKPELKLVEDFKPIALKMFISGSDKDEDFFLGEIFRRIDKVRSCYMEDFKNSYNDYALARMMLLDACFVINFISIYVDSTTLLPSNFVFTVGRLGEAVCFAALRDMVLLENQLPFWILKLVFNSRYGEDGYQFDHIALNFCFRGSFNGQAKETLMETEPLHLLEVSRRVLLNAEDDQDIQQAPHDFTFRCLDRWTENVHNNSGASRLGKFLKSECINFGCLDRCRKKERIRPILSHCVFRSVRELKSKGIHFRPSGIDSLKYASFTSHCYYAELSLPCWHVTEISRTFFQNLIAYEICPNIVTDAELSVTCYINFMKALITSPNDVRELREKKIIINRLGSDEEVVQVFRTLNTYGTESSSIFDEIKLKIEEHYSSKAQTWMAELVDTYFTSPWSLITLVAATLLLFLATVQTYYALPFASAKKS